MPRADQTHNPAHCAQPETPSIQERVDRWLKARAAWLAESEARSHLATQWHTVSLAFGAESAAAQGVLIALARKVFKCASLTTCFTLRGWTVSGPSINSGIVREGETDATVTALEAAP